MADETMTVADGSGLACPKDGTTMVPLGRRGGRGSGYRCQMCSGVFLDVDAMRRGRGNQPPPWVPVVLSVLMSVGMTLLVRRLRRGR